MEEVAVEFASEPALPLEHDPARAGEGADRRRLDALVGGDLHERRPVSRSHGEHHPLLCLRDPGLRCRQSLVFQRHAVEIDVGAERGSHLAHRA